MDPLISVVVITYNAEKFILQTLDSIKIQAYKNFEVIITDDASKDRTVEICQTWIEQNKQHFKHIEIISSAANTGIPSNLNRGIKAAKGEWIKGIAGDDLLLPGALQRYVDEINADKSQTKLAFHGKMHFFNDNLTNEPVFEDYGEKHLQKFNLYETTVKEQFSILLRFCPVSAPTAIIKKSVFETLNYYDERFKFWEDRPMWIKMTSHGIKFHYIDDYLVNYRMHSASVQNNANSTMFSRTILSMTDAYKEYIIPYLTRSEQRLYKYLFFIRISFYKMFNNKKTTIINILYKLLSGFAEYRLAKIKSRYKP